MTANIDYLGMRAMLRSLTKRGVITPREEEKIAARIAVTTGADPFAPYWGRGFKTHFFCLAKRNGFWIPKKRRRGKAL
jgi:hypothetical protein